MEQERKFPSATGEFSALLTQICLAAKIIHREVTRAGLVDLIGAVGQQNATGDQQQKLDVFAHDTLFRALDHTGQLCAVASEESEDVLPIPDHHPRGKYCINFDPLDGSSNIDVGVSIGTTFSILRRVTADADGPGTAADCMQPGNRQVCAGYVMYGSSTVLVYSSGQGVHQFIFDPSVGEFLLVQENVRMPERGTIYSVNEGNAHRWDDGVRRYVEWLKEDDKATGRPYRQRYVGTLVADFHRTLFKGGIFLYPGDRTNPRGKLRYLYEAAPIAFLAEQAGGAASDGTRRILDIAPASLHERTPLMVGSIEDVRIAEEFVQGRR
jgi:fructose-1,6-bisphosphatase I